MTRSVTKRQLLKLGLLSSVFGACMCLIVNVYYTAPGFETSTTFPRTVHRLVDFPEITRPNPDNSNTNARKHSILWYKPPSWISSKSSLSTCAFSNCFVTDEVGDIKSHSAVLFTLSKKLETYPPLTPTERPPGQAWVFFYMESTYNVWKVNGVISKHWRSTMNWSLTYRTDSDIVRPYGILRSKTTPDSTDYGRIFDRKTKLAAWFVSNCGAESGRDQYVKELRKEGVAVDIYGECGDRGRLSRSSQIDLLNKDYKFYFAFENTLCPDYITEKLFDNYNLDIVLVVRGGARYSELLPSGIFIDTSNFTSPKALAKYLMDVSSSKALYTEYLRNKDKYEAHGHGFLAEYSYCSLCEKLNTIEENKNIYEDLNSYIYNKRHSCVKPTDILNSYTFFSTKTIMLFILGISALFLLTFFNLVKCSFHSKLRLFI